MATKKISFSQLVKTMRFPQLDGLVQGLQGEEMLELAFGYGGEFQLHFGARNFPLPIRISLARA